MQSVGRPRRQLSRRQSHDVADDAAVREAAPLTADEHVQDEYLAALRALAVAEAIGTTESQKRLLRERVARQRERLAAALTHCRP